MTASWQNAAYPWLDSDSRETLNRYGLPVADFEKLQKRLRQGLSADINVVQGDLEPIRMDEVHALPKPTSSQYTELVSLGQQALKHREVGAVVLAGGMATRFGNVVKGATEVLPGRTFLDLKLAEIRHTAETLNAMVPVYIMTSVASDAAIIDTLKHLPQSPLVPMHTFVQFALPRCTPSGEIFLDATGKPSLYATGHGDLGFALARSGYLESFRKAGGKYLYMTNVDNLAATLEPAVIGAHIHYAQAISAEVVSKNPGDQGGAPAYLRGHAQIVEAFRFPKSFDQNRIPVFNTNSFVLNVDALERQHPLTWFAVQKKIAEQPVVQWERLVGELTAFVPTAFLHVERDGAESRFLPVKDPQELDLRRPHIEQVLQTRNVVPR